MSGPNVRTSCALPCDVTQSSDDQIFFLPDMMRSSSGTPPTSRRHVTSEMLRTLSCSANVPPWTRRLVDFDVDEITGVTRICESVQSAMPVELGEGLGLRLGASD